MKITNFLTLSIGFVMLSVQGINAQPVMTQSSEIDGLSTRTLKTPNSSKLDVLSALLPSNLEEEEGADELILARRSPLFEKWRESRKAKKEEHTKAMIEHVEDFNRISRERINAREKRNAGPADIIAYDKTMKDLKKQEANVHKKINARAKKAANEVILKHAIGKIDEKFGQGSVAEMVSKMSSTNPEQVS